MLQPPNANVDVAIVGAGPAGLSAALMLGRCRRNVMVFDHGQPRHATAASVHGFLSRDGIDPHELRRIEGSNWVRTMCTCWT